MTGDRPPPPGLTRKDTGYPHDVYRGWYLTPEAVAEIEDRIAHNPATLQDPLAGIGTRKHARLAPVPMDAQPRPKKVPPKTPPSFTPATCGYCGGTFLARSTGKRRTYCSNACRAKANHRKARGIVPIRSDEREAS